MSMLLLFKLSTIMSISDVSFTLLSIFKTSDNEMYQKDNCIIKVIFEVM